MTSIIAVFNGARYLGEAIESLLVQTHKPLTVIVVDDGSTDDSAAVAARFGDRVTVLSQANQGQPAALNHGISHATGDYVAFLDADDVWDPLKAARQVALLDARPDLAYCVTRIRNYVSAELRGRESAVPPEQLTDAPGYVVSTLMARRDAFTTVGGFDTRLRHANKTEWFLRARNVGALGEQIPEVLAHRRLHTNNRSQTYAQRSIDEYLGLVKASIDRSRRVSS